MPLPTLALPCSVTSNFSHFYFHASQKCCIPGGPDGPPAPLHHELRSRLRRGHRGPHPGCLHTRPIPQGLSLFVWAAILKSLPHSPWCPKATFLIRTPSQSFHLVTPIRRLGVLGRTWELGTPSHLGVDSTT